jgi:hypothetical protein
MRASVGERTFGLMAMPSNEDVLGDYNICVLEIQESYITEL